MDQRFVDIVGWGHTRFGRLSGETLESLIVSAAEEAMLSANIKASEIDEIVLANYNGGLHAQAFPSSLVLETDSDLLFTPATRVENACASGSAAIQVGLRAIHSGESRVVLVVGAEKMTDESAEAVSRSLMGATYEFSGTDPGTGFAGKFAQIAIDYFDKYGDHSDALAKIAAKNHRNGTANPYAHLRTDLGFDFCRTVSAGNPIVAPPLRRTDCSPISDGAAAIILSRPGITSSEFAVRIRGFAHANDFYPDARRDSLAFAAAHKAWNLAMDRAQTSLHDLDLVELHDCFTIAELLEYEVIGLCQPGMGGEVVEEGWAEREGVIPINVSGGLKAKGHPIGATGVSQHVMAAMQLTGVAGEMQLPNANVAGIFNMGGVAVANYASILERVQ